MFLKDKNLYYIGGIVRDEILGIQNFDTDFCYEGDAVSFAAEQNLNIIKTNPDFGTVRVKTDNKLIDIASTRTETYPQKGHLPKIEKIGCSLKEDVFRRDFTINTLAKRTSDNEIVDYLGGINDIKNKQLRILHNNSFIDDPTRIIRGLKFSVRFGFELDKHTKKLQDEYLDNINYDMSYHRIKKELIETFDLNKAEAFDRFVEQRIYRLLGENTTKPKISGIDIKNAVEENSLTDNVWLMYAAPFIDVNTTKLPLSKAEKRILEWVEKLKTKKPVSNTPKESIILSRLVNNV